MIMGMGALHELAQHRSHFSCRSIISLRNVSQTAGRESSVEISHASEVAALVIEQVAASDGPNQAMAKLLLAARAEGANSRWPQRMVYDNLKAVV
jgi:hypothetical protein